MSRHLPTLLVLGLLAGLASACGDQDSDPGWRVVALYDGATAAWMASLPEDDEPVQEPGAGYVWEAESSLESGACGLAKGPLGFGGLMDAEIMARARAPYLVVLLAGPSTEPDPGRQGGTRQRYLSSRDLRVFLKGPKGKYDLAPAVVPRSVLVDTIYDWDTEMLAKRLRSQLRIQLCLEHQIGRGWGGIDPTLGSPDAAVKNAFMLDAAEDDARRLFTGQGMAAPPLLGPPRWMAGLGPRTRQDKAPLQTSSPSLEAGDLFATRDPSGDGQDFVAIHQWARSWLPMTVGGAPCPGCEWIPDGQKDVTHLRVYLDRVDEVPPDSQDVGGTGPKTRVDAYFTDVSGGGQLSYGDKGGSHEPLWLDKDCRQPDGSPSQTCTAGCNSVKCLPDLLSDVPYAYPRFVARKKGSRTSGDGGDDGGHAIVALLIPNWQLINGRSRLERLDGPPAERLDAVIEEPPTDGVGWLLQNPSLLQIHLESSRRASMEEEADVEPGDGSATAAVDTDDLMGAVRPPAREAGPWALPGRLLDGLRGWGPSPDFRASSVPILLAGTDGVEPAQQAVAVRRGTGHLYLVGVLVCLVFGLAGLFRIDEIWVARPRERAWGWPSKKKEGLKELEQKATGSMK